MSEEITINNPLKIILKKNFKSKFELIKNYVTILVVSNNIELTNFEIETLSYFIEVGSINAEVKNYIKSKTNTSIATINNQLTTFRKLGLVSKSNILHKELSYNFTNPTLIYIKYGINNETPRGDEFSGVQGTPETTKEAIKEL